MFAAFTPALVLGAAAERGRILPIIVFVFVWATLVYDPIASWTWNSSGWAAELGVLDFAGGTPVHITSGASALAYSLMLGPRKQKFLQVPPPLPLCHSFLYGVAPQLNLHRNRHRLPLVRLARFQRRLRQRVQPPRRNGLCSNQSGSQLRWSNLAIH